MKKTLLLFFAFLCSMGMWAEELSIDFEKAASNYSDWNFSNLVTQKTNSNVTPHGGSYFGVTNGTATAYITTKNKIDLPGTFTCYVTKQTTNATSSNWNVQVSSNNTSWTTVKTVSASSMSRGTWVKIEADLSDYNNVYVRIAYDGTTAVRCIDDLTLETLTTSKTETSLSFSQTSFNINIGGYFTEPSLTATPSSILSSVSFSSSNTEVATVNSSTGKVAFTGKAGETTIKATFAGDDTYKQSEASYVITVTDPNLTSYTWNYSDASNQSTSETADVSFDAGEDFTFTFGSAAYNNSHFKWYAGKTFKIQAKNDMIITKVVLNSSESGYEGRGKLTTDKGTLSGTTWTGSANSITFTNGDTRQVRLSSIEITYIKTSYAVTINSCGNASFSCAKPLDFTDADVKAYMITAETADAITLTEIKKVPANTGIFVFGEGGTYNIPVLEGDADDASANKLTATTEPYNVTGSDNVWALSKNDGMLHPVNSGTISAGKAYLVSTVINPATQARGFVFAEDVTTGINAVSNATTNGVAYNLAGQRVAANTKGIVIINGKKYVK